MYCAENILFINFNRISPTNTKLYDLENQGHFPLMTLENYSMNYCRLIINIRVPESVYLQFYTTQALPICCLLPLQLTVLSRCCNRRVIKYTFSIFKYLNFQHISKSSYFNMIRLYKRVSLNSWLAFNMYPSLWKFVCIIHNTSIVPCTIDYTTFAIGEKVERS